MTLLQILNRKMLELEHNGDISEEEYVTYKWLLEWSSFSSCYIGDRLPIKGSQEILKKLHTEKSS